MNLTIELPPAAERDREREIAFQKARLQAFLNQSRALTAAIAAGSARAPISSQEMHRLMDEGREERLADMERVARGEVG